MPESNAPADGFEEERQGIMQFFQTVPFNKLMGIELIQIEPGRAWLSMSWRPDLCQPAGVLHGGAIATLIDTGIAHAILLATPNLDERTHGGRMVTIDLGVKYLRPVSEGRIFCEARVLRMGRQIVHASATVTNEAGKEVALGDSIYMLVTPEQLKKKDA